MVFLNPLVLWASLAIAVPIIVHLFNFRKPRQVLFSNLAFVRSVNQTVVQRLKLKQWLLLAARILAILALVFCFANPVIPENEGVVLNQDRSVVLVIDNSESMSTADPKGTLLQQARLLGEEILKAHPETDEFQVQTTAGLQYNTNFTTRELAIEALSEIDYGSNTLSLSTLLKSAGLLFTEAQNTGRQVYVLSDFQSSTVLADSLPMNLDLADNINLFLMPVGEQPSGNLYVSDIQSKNPILEPGEPVNLSLRLHNTGDNGLEDVGLRVSVDGREVSIGTVESIGVNSSVQTEISFTPQKGGWLSGKITLDDPEAEFDNVRYFSLYIPENQKLLVVEGDDNQQYVRLFYQKLLKSYRTKFVSEAAFGNSQLGEYEAVVLSGVSEVSSGARERLAQYVAEGGGLIVFPGKNTDKADLNALYARLEAGQWNDQQPFDQPLTFEEAAFDHPIFKGLFEQFDTRAGFDSPSIQRLWQFEPSGGNIQQVLLRASNNAPVLHESRYKDGRVFTFTLHPSLDWSDWPLKPSYAPLLFRTTLLATQREQLQLSRSIADDSPYRLPTGHDERLTLIELNADAPKELVPAVIDRAGSRLLQFDQSALSPGNYGLYSQDSLIAQIAFNAPEAESQLAYPTPDELEAQVAPLGEQLSVMNASPEVIRSEVQQASFGFQLWQYFLLFGLAMLLAEVLILKLLR